MGQAIEQNPMADDSGRDPLADLFGG